MAKKNLMAVFSIVVVGIFWFYLNQKGIRSPTPNIPKSISNVIMLSDPVFPSEIISSLFKDRLGWSVKFADESWKTLENSLKRIDQEVISSQPDLVIVGLGLEDLRQKVDLSVTLANLEQLFHKLQNAGIPIIYIGFSPSEVGDNWLMSIKNLCDSKQVGFIDLSEHKLNWSSPAANKLPPDVSKELAQSLLEKLKKHI